MSRVDKTRTTAIYEIEYDRNTLLPTRISMLVLAGRQGEESKDPEFGDVEHVVFCATYQLFAFGEVEPFDIPMEVRRILR